MVPMSTFHTVIYRSEIDLPIISVVIIIHTGVAALIPTKVAAHLREKIA